MRSSPSFATTRRSTSGSTSPAPTSRITIGTEMSEKLFVAVAALCAATAFAQPLETSRLRESVIKAPVVDAHGHRDLIDVTILRPDANGLYPITVLSHGSPRSAE